MDQSKRNFILESARRVEEWENTPRACVDPYNDMTSEEISKLLVYQQELLANKEREVANKERELVELNAKLDKLLESQTSMTVSMTEMASELKELRISNAAKDKEIKSLTELLKRNNQTMFGSKSQKAKTSKAVTSHEKYKDDFDGCTSCRRGSSTVRTHGEGGKISGHVLEADLPISRKRQIQHR